MFVAVAGSAAIMGLSAVTGNVPDLLYFFVLVGATVIYSLIRGIDSIRWRLSHTRQR